MIENDKKNYYHNIIVVVKKTKSYKFDISQPIIKLMNNGMINEWFDLVRRIKNSWEYPAEMFLHFTKSLTLFTYILQVDNILIIIVNYLYYTTLLCSFKN